MRFGVLDSWRGIAALFVASSHARFLGHYYDVPFIRNSWLFVDFFFVLSGFVITHAYEKRLVEGYDRVSFIIRRFGRLWPLHIAVLLGFLLAEILKLILAHNGDFTPDTLPFASDEKYSIATLISNVFLVQSLGIHERLSWNEPSWSISTEFYTYVLFALFCLLGGRDRRTIVASLLVAGGLTMIAWRSNSAMFATYDYGFFRCVCGFFTGYLIYHVYQACKEKSIRPPAFAEVVVTILIVLFVSFAGYGSRSLAAPFFFALVVWVFAFERGSISRFLSKKPFQRLGEWSYSIYMVHALLIMVISRSVTIAEKVSGEALRVDHENQAGSFSIELVDFGNVYLMDGLAVLYLVIVVVIASFTYRFIELPCRTYFNGIAKRRDERLLKS